MKKLIKFLPPMALLFGFGLTVLMSSFKSNSKFASVWYDVTLVSGQYNIGSPTTAPTTSGSCRIAFTGNLCKIKLPSDYTPPQRVDQIPAGTIEAEAKLQP